MRVKFETYFNSFLALLLLVLFWLVWTSMAQTNAPTAAPAAGEARTNRPVLVKIAQTMPIEPDVTPEWVEDLAGDFPFLKRVWWGNELWKYCASLIYIFLAFYISKFLDFATRVWLRRWAKKSETHFDDLVLDLLNGPVKIVAFVIFLHIGLGIFRWPERVQVLLSRGFTVVVACTLTYMLLKFIDLLMSYWRQRALATADGNFDEQLFPIIRKSLKVFVTVVAVLVTAQNLQINVTAAITSLSIGGLAIGLAAQDTLANLFGAVAIFMDKPFRLGDRIQLDAVDGNVESIGLRSTRVRNGKGYLVTIPNKTIASATITNVSRRPGVQADINFGLTYDTSDEKLHQALAILEEVFRSHPMTKDLVVTFNKFGDSALNILVSHGADLRPDKDYLAGMQELNLRIKERFAAAGIQFAFPSRTLYVKQLGADPV